MFHTPAYNQRLMRHILFGSSLGCYRKGGRGISPFFKGGPRGITSSNIEEHEYAKIKGRL
ncbi:MAG: hypothetical protein DWB56_01260 [Candidatus Jettenia sp.]|uniref:Uncharacterized protein n=1 Tax=Candidatus Jettenia caeni TaxID=247490 RepID=I3INY9_9BACT|nr:MAG: hypothetical protein EDM77_01180 [Candidatus Jettenia sp. AMX1]MBC6927582.1 hypothetical protein [Candidatus Jettenia sp.]GAB63434.1 hypothetical protein KSU1_D0125 [Candidatus Jettenia caeni]MCE7881303.1 hypothetical protein [Candidatus Jettenia sp. AMX1]MCQ3926020.1 hypothetical protein [Candidatus Jettenia sp.]